MATPEVVAEALRLSNALGAAQGELHRAVDPSDAQLQAEQAAYDALVDYVEANDLNYTEWDPR